MCSAPMEIHKIMNIYSSATRETTSLIHYTLVSCIQGNKPKISYLFFCVSEHFT